MGFFQKLSEGLSKTRNGLFKQMKEVFSGFSSVNEALYEELEEILIMADVGVATAEVIIDRLKLNVKEKGIKEPSIAFDEVKNIITDMMKPDMALDLSAKPAVILIIGVNGVGKTTSIGKIAHWYKKDGKSVVLAAGDTFRAAAIDQLEIWAQRCECPIIKHQPGSDPAAVIYDAAVSAKSRGADILLCDTAGRLHNKKNLMDELSKIRRVVEKEAGDAIETWLVLDASTGQNGISQAKLFCQSAQITGIILTKLDGTAKGGVVIAIKNELSIPVRFIGVGEGIDDLQPFDPIEFTDALFGKTREEGKEI